MNRIDENSLSDIGCKVNMAMQKMQVGSIVQTNKQTNKHTKVSFSLIEMAMNISIGDILISFLITIIMTFLMIIIKTFLMVIITTFLMVIIKSFLVIITINFSMIIIINPLIINIINVHMIIIIIMLMILIIDVKEPGWGGW